MKAVILAAGEGSRMRPLTYTRPKVMIPIANKPILEHLLIEAKKAGIGEFVFVVGYHDEQVRDYFAGGSRWGVSIEYRRQGRQLGTADALRMLEGLLGGDFLLINGDIIVKQKDIEGVMEKGGNAVSVFTVEDPQGVGVLELSKGRVVRIYEKAESPPSRMANAGIYRLTPDIFGAISRTVKSPRGEYELTDSLQLMIDSGQEVSSQEIGYWLNLSYPWDLLAANQSLLAEIEADNQGEVEENVVMKGKVSIGRNTVVRSGSYILGPVVIGQDCDIGPNCYIRPYTAIGDGCHVGGATEV